MNYWDLLEIDLQYKILDIKYRNCFNLVLKEFVEICKERKEWYDIVPLDEYCEYEAYSKYERANIIEMIKNPYDANEHMPRYQYEDEEEPLWIMNGPPSEYNSDCD